MVSEGWQMSIPYTRLLLYYIEVFVYIIIYLTHTYKMIAIDIIIVHVSVPWIHILIFIIFVNVKIKILVPHDYLGHQPFRKKQYDYTTSYYTNVLQFYVFKNWIDVRYFGINQNPINLLYVGTRYNTL